MQPFSPTVTHAHLDDLRARLRATRRPEPATDPTQGVEHEVKAFASAIA